MVLSIMFQLNKVPFNIHHQIAYSDITNYNGKVKPHTRYEEGEHRRVVDIRIFIIDFLLHTKEKVNVDMQYCILFIVYYWS